MNMIQKSMSEIRATEELKNNTLRYLMKQQNRQSRIGMRPAFRYLLAAVCLFLLLGAGSYSVYRKPVSYISIDVNPSIELGINRFGKVVSADAYNEDGQIILQRVSLKNISYIQAINKLLEDEINHHYLGEGSLLVFTVISDHSHEIIEDINTNALTQAYNTLMYIGDIDCMEDAHSHAMSFGRYRAYRELSQYDKSVTVEDCHGMTMSEIQTRIEDCRHHGGTQNQGTTQEQGITQEQGTTQNQGTTQEQGTTQDQGITQEQNTTQEQDTTQNQNGHHGNHHGMHH